MVLFSQKSVAFTLATFCIIAIASYFSGFIQKKMSPNNDEVIRKYLLNDSPLYGHNRPKLWIHTTYEYNARKWQSFGSRSSTDLNQPYLHLTIRSIIHHCGNSFHICLIDDDSFNQLIPEWNVQVKNMPDPQKSHYRSLAMAQLLYIYGGIVVPNSFICMKDLAPFYETCMASNKPFVCEMPNIYPNLNSANKVQKFTSSPCFMGAKKQDKIMKNYAAYIMQLNEQTPYSSETEFFGYHSKWLNIQVYDDKIDLLDGLQIGIKDKSGKAILLENLMEEEPLELCPERTYGVYIPRDEVLKRVKYQWFAVMNSEQLLETDMIVTKYLLYSLSKENNDMLIRKSVQKSVTSI